VQVRSRPMGAQPRSRLEGRAQRAVSRGTDDPGSAVAPVYAERPADPDFSSMVDDLQVDLRPANEAASDGTVTILFSDIESSTQLADRLGDRRWLDVVREHNKLVREQVAIAGGREVKAQGDGFMVTFPGASRALRCAIEIERALEGWRETHPDTPVHVRIGIHTGEVLADEGDIYGKHVMIAARIASQARGGEVLASSLVRELADGSDISFGAGRDVELRGLDRPWRLYPVDWTDQA
jgi:class 3 adenylate cyclase